MILREINSAPSLTFGKALSHFDQLASIEEQWKEIYHSKSRNSIFLSFDFIKLWYSCFARLEEVRVYPVVDRDRIIGFLPLFLSKRWQVRVLSSLTNAHCLHAGPLVGNGFDEIFASNFMEALLTCLHGWDILQYHEGYSFQAIASFKHVHGGCLYVKEHIEPTYTVLLPKSFDEYFNRQLSGKVRNNLKGWKKKLTKIPSHKFCHYIGDDAVAFWPTFLSIEDSGWKGREGSSIKRLNQNYQSYYERLVHMLSVNGLLHMYFLEIDGRPVAGVFGYEDLDVFHYAKIGYIEEYSSFSPSHLLFIFIVEDIINSLPTVKRLHMFPWDYGYKHRYINEKSYLAEFTLYNRTFPGNAEYFLSAMKRRIKLFPGMNATIGFSRKLIGRKSI